MKMGKLNDMFKSLFGFPKDHLGPDDLPSDIHADFQQEFGHNFGRENQHRGHDHFYHPPDGTWFSHDEELPDDFVIIQEGPETDMFEDIEDMFKNLFQGFGHQGGIIPPDFFSGPYHGPGAPLDNMITPPDNEQERPEDLPAQGGSLRDRMLKQPGDDSVRPHLHQIPEQDSNQDDIFHGFNNPHSWFGGLWKSPFGDMSGTQEKVDKDLDSEVEKGKKSIDDILSRKGDPTPPPDRSRGPYSSSSSSSFSSITTIDSNGRSESKTTRRDSSGNEEVIVTRRIGDKEHTIKRRRDDSGTEDIEEDLVNMDQDNLSEFDESWSKPQTGHPRPYPPMLGDGRFPSSSPLSSLRR